MKSLQDIRVAISVFFELRHARAAGKNVQVKRVYEVPVLRLGYWSATMEGCLFYGAKWHPIWDVFDGLPAETQRALTFAPKDGEWGDRVRFWQQQLRPSLEPELYHEAILTLIQWGIRCRRREAENRHLTAVYLPQKFT